MKYKKVSLVGMLIPFLIMTIVLTQDMGVQTEAAAGTWVTINVNHDYQLFGEYEYSSTRGHWVGTEEIVVGLYSSTYIFTMPFTAQSYIPSRYVDQVRVKFYLEDYHSFWGNEAIYISISTTSGIGLGSYYYDPDNYNPGAYIYIYLSSLAQGQKLKISYRCQSGVEGWTDGGQSCFVIDPPVIQYYSTVPIY